MWHIHVTSQMSKIEQQNSKDINENSPQLAIIVQLTSQSSTPRNSSSNSRLC